MTHEATIRVRVDPSNPGQFFACCGLLELTNRIWGAEAWFDEGAFSVAPLEESAGIDRTLRALIGKTAAAELRQLDPDDDYASPIQLGEPFDLRLDWWTDKRSGGKNLKVWAGSMRSVRIARAMQSALKHSMMLDEGLFDRAEVVHDPAEPDKKVEPFYFDSRRGSSAHPIDIGFSPDTIPQMVVVAFPAVEFLCLVGLQRYRPMPTGAPRVFRYQTWNTPLDARLAQAAICGILPTNGQTFVFESAFRTDQKKHKAFAPASPTERT